MRGFHVVILDRAFFVRDHLGNSVAIAHRQATSHGCITIDGFGHRSCRAAAITDGTPRDKLTHRTLTLTEIFVLVAALIWPVVETGKAVQIELALKLCMRSRISYLEV